MQAMIGVSLRARWDATLVFLIASDIGKKYMFTTENVSCNGLGLHLYYKRRRLYFCSAKAPVLDGSGSRR